MKRAILTGASSGLGRALAFELLKHGYQVALVGRNQNAMMALLNGLPSDQKAQARMIKADLSKLSEVDGLVEKCGHAFGDNKPVTHLINNAGFSVTGRVEDIPLEQFDLSWRVNFLSPAALCQQAILHFRKAGEGMIVNVGSGVARRALPYNSPYCVAKAALHSFTESLRVELKETKIKVMMFSPGPVISNFHAAQVHCGNTKIVSPAFDGKQAEEIAGKFFKAIEARKERVVLGTKATLSHHLNYWSPKLTDFLLHRMFRIEEKT